MTHQEFNEVVARRLGLIEKVLASKGAEYVGSEPDRFHNFKLGAALQRCTPEECLLGYVTKQLVSTVDLIKATSNGSCPAREVIDEKLGDIINYALLLEGLFLERLQQMAHPAHIATNQEMNLEENHE